jgi:hypothetical protein
MEYEIKTIKDVFDQVPSDRIVDCLTELAVGMARAKRMHEARAESTGGAIGIAWPETVTWVDDGAGSLEIRYQGVDGADLFVERATVSQTR